MLDVNTFFKEKEMAKRRRSKKSNRDNIENIIFSIFVAIVVIGAIGAVGSFISEHFILFIILCSLVVAGLIAYAVIRRIIRKQRETLLRDILNYLNLGDIDNLLSIYDQIVIVKSRQAPDNYDDIRFLKDNDCFEDVRTVTKMRKSINQTISSFLEKNEFTQRPQPTELPKHF